MTPKPDADEGRASSPPGWDRFLAALRKRRGRRPRAVILDLQDGSLARLVDGRVERLDVKPARSGIYPFPGGELVVREGRVAKGNGNPEFDLADDFSP